MLHVVLDLYPLSYPTHGPGAQQEPSLGYDRRGSLQWLPARVMFVLSRWHTQRRCGRWRPAAKTPACTSTARHVPTSLSSSNCSARTSPSTMLRDRPGHPLLAALRRAISPNFIPRRAPAPRAAPHKPGNQPSMLLYYGQAAAGLLPAGSDALSRRTALGAAAAALTSRSQPAAASRPAEAQPVGASASDQRLLLDSSASIVDSSQEYDRARSVLYDTRSGSFLPPEPRRYVAAALHRREAEQCAPRSAAGGAAAACAEGEARVIFAAEDHLNPLHHVCHAGLEPRTRRRAQPYQVVVVMTLVSLLTRVRLALDRWCSSG